jgi:transcriptional regulator with XRE-family HTH domain
MAEPGALVRQARLEAGLSIRALAETAGVSASTVSRIEAGRMDPTVGMLERLLASAGTRMDISARATPQLAALVDAWHSSPRGDVIDWTRLRAFADHLALHPQDAPSAIRRMPAPSESALLDNLLAGIAETQADLLGLDRPAWTTRVPALREPWASPGTPRMRSAARATTPPALAARGLTVARTSIWRERIHAG